MTKTYPIPIEYRAGGIVYRVRNDCVEYLLVVSNSKYLVL